MKSHALFILAGTLAWAIPAAAAEPSAAPPPLPAIPPPPAAAPPAPPSPSGEPAVMVEPAPARPASPDAIPRATAPISEPAPASRDESPGLSASHEPPSPAMWRVEAGYRASFVTDPGYNPFSSQDFLGQVSVVVSRTLFVAGAFSFAPGLSWDYGQSNATARGDSTTLGVHRLLVPLEGRVHFGRLGYALLRLAPGVAVQDASVDDAASPAHLTKNRWLFAGDLSAGYAFPVVPHTGAAASSPGLWLQADGGYGFTTTERLDLTASNSPSTRAVDLGDLSMRGGFFRIAVAMGF